MGQTQLDTHLRATLSLFDEERASWTTAEVATRLGVSRDTARARLERLAGSGFLGNAATDVDGHVWWRLDSGGGDTTPEAREGALVTRMRQQAVVSELGQRALDGGDIDVLLTEAVESVSETLGTGYCKVLYLDEATEELHLTHGVGWDDGIVGSATVSAVEDDSQAAYTLATERAVVVEDFDSETRFSGPDLLTDHDVSSGISTIIGSVDEPWGVLGTHDTDVRSFSRQDAMFVQAVANVVASAVERHEYERELLEQRAQTAAVNNISDVVSSITSAVIEQSTREEIEATVCEQLAGSDSYQFAWIGDVDAATRTVECRTEAGVEGYLDDITISVDPDEPESQGPTGRAFRTRELQTAQHAPTEPQFSPWPEVPERYDFQSSAAIPIVHETSIYGVLNVYADRPSAFEDREGEVVGQLGEIVGHAIAATERKRALLSDEVVELEFRIERLFEALGIETDTDATIALDHVVPVVGGEFLLFGRTTPAGTGAVRSMVETIPCYGAVSFREVDDDVRFELRVSEPPVLSALAGQGGSIEDARIEDGDYRLRVHLPPSCDVSNFAEVVRETYPTAALVKRRQLSVEVESDTGVHDLLNDLTDCQRTALEAAYYAGFFSWPREASGEDVADSLGIAAPTFHQHLRKAKRKVFDSVFDAAESPHA